MRHSLREAAQGLTILVRKKRGAEQLDDAVAPWINFIEKAECLDPRDYLQQVECSSFFVLLCDLPNRTPSFKRVF